jgi:hypothetical protein
MSSTKTMFTLTLGSAFFLGLVALSKYYELMFPELITIGFILGCIGFMKLVTTRK